MQTAVDELKISFCNLVNLEFALLIFSFAICFIPECHMYYWKKFRCKSAKNTHLCGKGSIKKDSLLSKIRHS